jgi:hypothetical protein
MGLLADTEKKGKVMTLPQTSFFPGFPRNSVMLF